MVRELYLIVMAMRVLLIFIAIPLSSVSQSKHNEIWYICGYKFDFSSSPVKISLEKRLDNNSVWYVNENGNHTMTCAKGVLYDENMVEIKKENKWQKGFFVPAPYDESFVYYFEGENCHLIDGNRKIVYENKYNVTIDKFAHIVVHHSQCDKIWLINISDTVISEYLLSLDGLEKVRDIIIAENVGRPSSLSLNINLSVDCKYYTMTNRKFNDFSEVFFGKFDRQTGLFTRTASYDFSENYSSVFNSIIAPDNSRVYYVANTKNERYQIFEVPIIDEIPQFENKKIIVDKSKHGNYFSAMYYAIDGKVYVVETTNRMCSTLSIAQNGSTEYKQIYDFGSFIGENAINYVSSWFMDSPCVNSSSENPCDNIVMSELSFDNSFVCFGEMLSVSSATDDSFSFDYIWDDKKEFTANVIDGKCTIDANPGCYKITKVYLNGCSFTLPEPIEGRVGTKVHSPKIISDF